MIDSSLLTERERESMNGAEYEIQTNRGVIIAWAEEMLDLLSTICELRRGSRRERKEE